MPRTILLTGFGPFPGAPKNPTGTLVQQLARRRRANLRVIPHIFATRYDAVDLDLPALIRKHRPDALLMFGLANRTRTLRIETLARNALSAGADAAGVIPVKRAIAPRKAGTLALRVPAARLLATLRRARVTALLSRNAGNYLCNYLCWRAAEASPNGALLLAAFVHVPPSRRPADAAHLLRAGEVVLSTLSACLAGARKRS